MKKNLLLIIFVLLEFLFVVCFAVPQFKEVVLNIFPLLNNLWDSFKLALSKFADLIYISDLLSEFPKRLTYAISLIIVNLIIIIFYEIVASILVFIIRRSHKKNLIANKLDTYELTEEEKARFSWKLYQRRFSWVGFFSFIIPTLVILFFILLRFDVEICKNDRYNDGFSLIYTNSLKPFINSLFPIVNDQLLKFITKYISLTESVFDVLSIKWVEYVLIALTILAIYFIWFLFVWITKKIFNKSNAKKRAKRSKKKYIAKMERRELKARKAAGARISSNEKSSLNKKSINEYYDDVSMISLRTNVDLVSYSDMKSADYFDDISAGVVDLGIASTGEEEEKEPIEKKIPIFVGEEDVDIILENEPIIETIEEENNEDDYDEEEPFFEKYIPEKLDLTSLDESLLIQQVEVIDEEVHFKQKENVIGIKEFEEKEIQFSSDTEKADEVMFGSNQDTHNAEIVYETINEDSIIKENITPINIPLNELNTDGSIEEKEEIMPLEFTPKKGIKKPIKPISVNSKYSSEDRFKDAKKKYLKIDISNDDNKEVKKRQLIKRKKQNEK